MSDYKNPTCKGCYALGTACERCDRCKEERDTHGYIGHTFNKPSPAHPASDDEKRIAAFNRLALQDAIQKAFEDDEMPYDQNSINQFEKHLMKFLVGMVPASKVEEAVRAERERLEKIGLCSGCKQEAVSFCGWCHGDGE